MFDWIGELKEKEGKALRDRSRRATYVGLPFSKG